jgi:hypothetical protein
VPDSEETEPDSRPLQRVDPADFQKRLDSLSELFSTMMVTVDDLTTRRCPYKNRFDQCTANFGCRNQRKPRNPGELKVCGSDDKLDYRSAWETD